MSKKKTTSKSNNVSKVSEENAVRKVSAAAMYSGPLPPPSHMQEYEKILPGSAERILSMAEKQQSHTHKLEESALAMDGEFRRKDISYFSRGQLFAFLVTLMAGLLVYTLAEAGHNTLAGVIGTSTIVALATAFIYGFTRKTSK